jgi:hypothetical protein
MQLTRRWQIGVSAGVVMQTIATSECISTGGDTGAPAAPGNIWALRIGGRGEFL